MTCRDLVAFLGDYVSGDLSPEKRAAFDAHLERCPSCQSYVRTYLEASKLARAVLRADAQGLPTDVPEGLVRAVLAAQGEIS